MASNSTQKLERTNSYRSKLTYYNSVRLHQLAAVEGARWI